MFANKIKFLFQVQHKGLEYSSNIKQIFSKTQSQPITEQWTLQVISKYFTTQSPNLIFNKPFFDFSWLKLLNITKNIHKNINQVENCTNSRDTPLHRTSTSVHSLMSSKSTRIRELRGTKITSVRFLPGVNPHVNFVMPFLRETLSTCVACERALTAMLTRVSFDLVELVSTIGAEGTSKAKIFYFVFGAEIVVHVQHCRFAIGRIASATRIWGIKVIIS